MKIIMGIERLERPLRKAVATLGNFDGVHLGHQKIFEKVKSEAHRLQGEAVVVTFEPHPLTVLSPEHRPSLLTSFPDKMRLIEDSGIDTVLCLEFTRMFSRISPLEFIKEILLTRVGVKKIIVGYNYHFGRDKAGDAETLKTVGGSFQMEVEIVEPLIIDGTVVSSSKIREFLKEGNVESAGRLLGRDYSISGKVIEGAKRGRTLGFPTANLAPSDGLYPKTGVYAVQVDLKGEHFNGVANIGINPTFESAAGRVEERLSFEVFVLDFDRNIYGEELKVDFKTRIRDEVRFTSTADLIRQIQNDVEWAEQNVFNAKDKK